MCTALPFMLFTDSATTDIYTLSLHDALPILRIPMNAMAPTRPTELQVCRVRLTASPAAAAEARGQVRSEEHTSELQSLRHLVCRLLLAKKNPTPVATADMRAHTMRRQFPTRV